MKLDKKKTLTTILSFVLCLMLIVFCFSMPVSLTLLNREYVLSKILTNDYIRGIQSEFTEESEILAEANGVDKKIIDEVFTYETIKNNTETYFTNSVYYEGKYDINKDTASLKKTLSQKIESQFEKEGVNINNIVLNDIDSFSNEIINLYNTFISQGFINDYAGLSNKYSILFTTINFVSITISFALIALIYKLTHRKYKALDYVTYALLGSTIITFVPALYGFSSKIYDRIAITPAYTHDVLSNIIKSVFLSIGVTGLIELIVSFVLIIISHRLYNNRRS